MRPGGCMNKFICENEDYTMNIQSTRKQQNAVRAAIAICEAKGGLVNATKVANQAWIDAGEPYPLPVGEYRRYSWLMADLNRMQMQLAEQLRDLELAAGYPVDEETGCDLREWCGNDIQASHAEALDMNEWHGLSEEQRAVQNERIVYGINLMHKMDEDSAVEACHAEALALNEMVDDAVVFGTTTNENAWPNARNDAVAKIRDDLINYYGKVEPRFIIKMMISVRNLARKATDAKIAWWNEVMSRPSSPEAGSEIPF